jgi:shikimate 5-dehydrogenase
MTASYYRCMTNPRTNPERELMGILGSLDNTSEEMSWWNAEFKKLGMDAALSRYPTEVDTLPERLSEMFHFDRRGYIVGKGLQEAIIPLLDYIDSSVELALNGSEGEGTVDTVHNAGGVMTGYFCDGNRKKRWTIWHKS